MALNRQHKRIAVTAFVAALLLLSTYKLIIAHEIQSLFQKQGLDSIELLVDSASLTHAKFKYVVIGDSNPIEIGEVEIDYTPLGLWEHYIKAITMRNGTIRADVDNGTFSFEGLSASINPTVNKQPGMLVPDYFFDSRSFFFDSLTLEDSTLYLKGRDINLTVPFSLSLNKETNAYHLTIAAQDVAGTFRNDQIASKKLSASLQLSQENEWRGQWETDPIEVRPDKSITYQLMASGKTVVNASVFEVDFLMKSNPLLIDSEGGLYLMGKKSGIMLSSLDIPWAGGVVSTDHASLPFERTLPVQFNVNVSHVALQELLAMVGIEDAAATGHMSGPLMPKLMPNGNLLFYNSTLVADEPGTLSIPAQALLREANDDKEFAKNVRALKDFHYDHLALQFESIPDHPLALVLTAQGSNPSENHGKPFEIQTKIGGNLTEINKTFVLLTTPPRTPVPEPNKPKAGPEHKTTKRVDKRR